MNYDLETWLACMKLFLVQLLRHAQATKTCEFLVFCFIVSFHDSSHVKCITYLCFHFQGGYKDMEDFFFSLSLFLLVLSFDVFSLMTF